MSVKIQRLVGLLLCAGVFVGLAAWSWGKWADPQVDYGRELYVPWRLAEGEVLFRDLAWFNGPLSQYVNALWFSLFGRSYWTLAYANLALLAVAAFVLYRLLRHTTDRWASFAAVLVLLSWFSFNNVAPAGPIVIANYNWVCPYSHELTHGILLTLVALLCTARFARRGQLGWAAAVGFVLGCTFLTKAEVFAAAAVGVVVTMTGLLAGGRARWLPAAGWFAGAAVVPPLVAWVVLATAMPVGDAWVAMLGSWPGVVSSSTAELEFYQRGMGLDQPGENVSNMLSYGGAVAVLLALCAAVGLVVRARGAAIGAAVGAAAVGVGVTLMGVDWLRAATPLPLFLAVAGVALAVAWIRNPDARTGTTMRIGLVAMALVMLFKMILWARVQQYGFALAMPAGVVLAAAVTGWLPAALRRGASGLLLRGGAFGLLLGAAVQFIAMSDAVYAFRVEPMGSDRERFYADPRGGAIKAALHYCRTTLRLPADAEVLVLPEGVTFNYLLKRRTPTRFVNFMPPEMVLFGEDNMIAELEASPPDAVVLIHKPTSEYGFEFFGVDYGQRIMQWIHARYEAKVAPFGQPPLRAGTVFGVQVLEPR